MLLGHKYVKVNELGMKPLRQSIIKHVAKRLNIAKEELASQVYKYREYNEVFGVNWAAIMMAKVNSGETEGNINTFRNIAKNRIAQYDQDFGKVV